MAVWTVIAKKADALVLPVAICCKNKITRGEHVTVHFCKPLTLEELGLNKEDYEFYLDLRKFGSSRHAGFGLGFERMIMYLTGMGNIRDVIPFPRTVNNCEL